MTTADIYQVFGKGLGMVVFPGRAMAHRKPCNHMAGLADTALDTYKAGADF